MGWIVAVGTVLAVVAIVVVLARQGNPADPSEQAGSTASWNDHGRSKAACHPVRSRFSSTATSVEPFLDA
jgi:hypothetical protein